jgi:hypothetical protein
LPGVIPEQRKSKIEKSNEPEPRPASTELLSVWHRRYQRGKLPFPLEKECDQGRSILASAPKTFLQLQEFSPYGLHQTYRDEATNLELPLFVVFNLEGNHQLSFEITTDSIAPTAEPKSLPSYLPFQKTQTSVREINKRRDRGERAAGRISLILGIAPVLAYFFAGLTTFPAPMEAGILMGGWLLGSLLTYVFRLSVLNRFLPWKKL